jgi:TMEM175 potassium channel family protein
MSDPARSDAPFDLTTERLEAFSDAVIAVIITILALGLEIPQDTSWATIRGHIGPFLIYVLAFVNLAIWWNNHHHLLRATTRINGAVMWANMALLFFLSLIPVATAWLRTSFEAKPAAFFGIVSLCAALAYSVLVRTIIRANGPDSVVARSLHGDAKGLLSIGLFAAGVGIAALNVWVPMGRAAAAIPLAFYVAVAIIWLIPDRRFLHDHTADGSDSPPGHPQ